MENAVCSKCHLINTDTKFKTCVACREAQRGANNRFNKRKKKSIKLKEVILNENFDVDLCSKCGKLKQDTQFKNCLSCRQIQNESTKRWKERNTNPPKKKKEYTDKYCSVCREKKDDFNYKSCSSCRNKQREANRKFHKENPNYTKEYYHKMFWVKRDEEAIIDEFLKNIR